MEALSVGLFLAVASNRIVEYIVAPIQKRNPGVDFWWLLYVTWAAGGVLAWFANINLFEPYIPDAELVGRILTVIVVGGGSQLIHDIFSTGEQEQFAG